LVFFIWIVEKSRIFAVSKYTDVYFDEIIFKLKTFYYVSKQNFQSSSLRWTYSVGRLLFSPSNHVHLCQTESGWYLDDKWWNERSK